MLRTSLKSSSHCSLEHTGMRWPRDDIAHRFRLGKRLGRGSFGSVHRVVRIADGRTYALKQVCLRKRGQGPRLAEDALNEVRLLASLHHPHIIRFHEAFVVGQSRYDLKLCIVMEYAGGGDLEKEIQKARAAAKPV